MAALIVRFLFLKFHNLIIHVISLGGKFGKSPSVCSRVLYCMLILVSIPIHYVSFGFFLSRHIYSVIN